MVTKLATMATVFMCSSFHSSLNASSSWQTIPFASSAKLIWISRTRTVHHKLLELTNLIRPRSRMIQLSARQRPTCNQHVVKLSFTLATRITSKIPTWLHSQTKKRTDGLTSLKSCSSTRWKYSLHRWLSMKSSPPYRRELGLVVHSRCYTMDQWSEEKDFRSSRLCLRRKLMIKHLYKGRH